MRITWMIALPLAACVNGPDRPVEPARFDLGPHAPTTVAPGGGIRAVDVVTTSWLAGSRMQYRLLYADPARRLSYAESVWVAPPADLIKQSLTLGLASEGIGGCRLQVKLDEFAQVFESPTISRFALEGRANLYAESIVVASHGFTVVQPAASADAKGGVAAAASAARVLEDELADWLRPHLSHCRLG